MNSPNPAYYEEDYRPVAPERVDSHFLPGSSVEIVHARGDRRPPRHALFDFDGTLSLVRQGWMDVMTPMMVEVLRATGTGETPQQLHHMTREFVMELTGKQTVYQMIRLADEVRKRGGQPKDPLEYKQIYHDRLMERIAGRREALRSGDAAPQEMLVPYSMELLEELRRRDVALYVASGTDKRYVVEEVCLLGLDPYFGQHVYGALDDIKSFSKAMVIQQILSDNQVEGASLVGFGDGYVEIQNVKAVGGTAVAVASDEVRRSGLPDEWKRDRLIGGARHGHSRFPRLPGAGGLSLE